MEKCDDGTPALKGLLAADRGPIPVRGRASYSGSRAVAVADIAGSEDLGFTAGSWVHTAAAGGTTLHGEYLTVWKRDSASQWQVEFDGGISHDATAGQDQPIEASIAADCPAPHPPPQNLVAQDAGGKAVRDFQETCIEDGFPAALRTYARTADFRFFTDGASAMDLPAAIRHLSLRAVQGSWRQDACDRSADSSLAYAAGVLAGGRQQHRYLYAQIWQYAPKVANWGLRILLINPVRSDSVT